MRTEPESTRRDPAIVLVAHPDDALRTLHVESLLFFTNFRVLEAQAGREVVERARRHRPKVVILSTRLPELDCHSIVQALRSDPATRDATPLVLGASEADARWVDLTEPVLPRELIRRVKLAVGASGRTVEEGS